MPRIPGTNIRIGPNHGYGHMPRPYHPHHVHVSHGHMPGYGNRHMAAQDLRGAAYQMGNAFNHIIRH